MTEVETLRARVDALERSLADLQKALQHTRPPQAPSARRGMSLAALALTVVAAVAAVRAQETRQLVIGPGGLIVMNEQGKPALTMQSLPGVGGRVAVFDGAGQMVAQLVSSGDCCGRLEILDTRDNQPKTIVGVTGTMGAVRMRTESDAMSQVSARGFAIRGESSPDPVVVIRDDSGGLVNLRNAMGAPAVMLNSEDTNGMIRAYGPSGIATVLGSSNGIGMLRLNSTNPAAMLAQGDGKIAFTNASGIAVMAVGGNSDGGYFIANNNGGKEAATLSVGGDGTGRVQLWRSGELSLIAGTTNGKGDLCVNGTKGSLCMGLLGVKTFTQY